MKVSEEQRRTLFELLRSHLDEETARLVLEVTVPANIELATRGDTQELRAEMLLRFAQIDGRITEVEGTMLRQILALHDRMGGLEARIGGLEARMSDVEARIGGLEARMGGLEAKLTERLYKVVVPVLIASNVLIVAVATWIGTVVG
jgi:BMFP domain-containing protein YqiC